MVNFRRGLGTLDCKSANDAADQVLQFSSFFGGLRPRGRRSTLALGSVLIALVLAGCSSGGGSSSSGSNTGGNVPIPPPVPPVATPNWATAGVSFNSTLAQQILNSAEFKAADANCLHFGCAATGPAPVHPPQAYELHNLDDALSSGLNGTGKLVAAVDVGFRTTHQEFAGKSILHYGNLPIDDHGTHVASLIAGVRDGRGMFGVAPGASLHLTAINPSGGTTLDLANVTGGTLQAASLGAVAQNNSWGFEIAGSTLQAHLASHPGESVAQGMNAVIASYGANNWQAYLDALNTFQSTGVVVWALSNTETITSGDVMATLPAFDTRLQGAWITAGNGYFETNSSGVITSAVRLSAACGLAAKFCLMGDGTTTGASAANDTDYAAGTGSSYVAPQVAGAVALLSQAFPDLTPQEWTKRLLASANNSWFTALGVPIDGTVDFGNGVTHGYSNEWGQGVLDIAAALRPIGTVSVLSGTNVVTSERTSLDDSTLALPAAFGDGLKTALGGTDVAVFDALNRGYAIEGSALVAPQQVTILPKLMANVGAVQWGDLPSYRTILANEPDGPRGAGIALTSDMAGVLETEHTTGVGGDATVFSLVHDGVVLTGSRRDGLLEVSAAGFAGHDAGVGQDLAAGGGINLAIGTPASKLSLGLSYIGEQGGVLGMGDGASFGFGDSGNLATVHLGIDQQLSETVALFGRLEYGSASPGGDAGALVTSVGSINYSGFALGTSLTGLVASNDSLSFSLSQPLRVETGTARFSLPSARTADGEIVRREVSADLAPAGRQLDLGLSYKTPIQNGQLQIGLQYSLDAGHIKGASAIGGAVGLQKAF